MILEESTYILYGYYSSQLMLGSGKKVIIMCDNCGKTRPVSYQQETDLCKFCADTSQVKRDKMRELVSGNKHPCYGLFGEDHPAFGRTPWNKGQITGKMSIESNIKKSEFQRQRYDKMDNPGQEIVGHHVAYDFNRPNAFVVKITRSFHGRVHHPKGQPAHEFGYSLMD